MFNDSFTTDLITYKEAPSRLTTGSFFFQHKGRCERCNQTLISPILYTKQMRDADDDRVLYRGMKRHQYLISR